MLPMTMIESLQTMGSLILSNQNDEEFGEEVVELFIANANAVRRAKGLPDLSVGALAPPDLSGTLHV